MTDHSHNWYDGATTRERTNDISNNVDTKKLKDNIHAFQVQANQLAQMVLTNTGKRVKAKTKIGKEDMKEPVPRDLPVVQPYVPLMLFLGHLKGNSYKTHEVVCMIRIPKKTHTKAEVDNGWDITIKDVERLRQILTPTVRPFPNLEFEPVVQPCMPLSVFRDEANVAREEEHDNDIPLKYGVMQPLTPQTFGKKFFDITRVDEKANGNPIKDVKDLSEIIKTYDFETFIQKLLHRVPASRRWNSRSPRLGLCGKIVAECSNYRVTIIVTL
ncbi:hypothetical protein Tco_0999911 [Tanacetum coccineum]